MWNVVSVSVTFLKMRYPNASGINVTLTNPQNQTVVLFSTACPGRLGTADRVDPTTNQGEDFVFSDSEPAAVNCSGVFVHGGHYTPVQPLNTLTGNAANGTWVIGVNTSTGGGRGYVDEFDLTLVGATGQTAVYNIPDETTIEVLPANGTLYEDGSATSSSSTAAGPTAGRRRLLVPAATGNSGVPVVAAWHSPGFTYWYTPAAGTAVDVFQYKTWVGSRALDTNSLYSLTVAPPPSPPPAPGVRVPPPFVGGPTSLAWSLSLGIKTLELSNATSGILQLLRPVDPRVTLVLVNVTTIGNTSNITVSTAGLRHLQSTVCIAGVYVYYEIITYVDPVLIENVIRNITQHPLFGETCSVVSPFTILAPPPPPLAEIVVSVQVRSVGTVYAVLFGFVGVIGVLAGVATVAHPVTVVHVQARVVAYIK